MEFHKEGAQGLDVPLSRLAKHPADGLVHQVVRMRDEMFGQPECFVETPHPLPGMGCDHGGAFAPQVTTVGPRAESMAHFID